MIRRAAPGTGRGDTMKRRCHDTLHRDRCELEMGHGDIHQNGPHQWGAREVPVPLWRQRPVPAKEMTRETP